MPMDCDRLKYVFIQILSILYIKQIHWIRQKLHKVWSGERKMKALSWRYISMALFRVVLQREIKQAMVAKWRFFLLLYHFAIVSTTRNLVVIYLQKNSKKIFKINNFCFSRNYSESTV